VFNLAYLTQQTVPDQQEALSVTIHEIMHIIGFNPQLFQYFRDPVTGQPLTNHIG